MKLLNHTLERPYLITVIVVCLVILAGAGAPGIKLANDYKSYFDSDFQPLVAYQMGQEEFTPSDNIFIAIHTPKDTIFQRNILDLVEQLTESAWQTPNVSRVDSISNYRHTFVDGDMLTTEGLFENNPKFSDEQLSERKKIALLDPILRNNIVSPDGKTTAINISINLQPGGIRAMPEDSVSYIKQLLDDVSKQYDGVDLFLSGELPFNLSFAEASEKDTQQLFPVLFFVIIMLLVLIFRNVSSVLATTLVISFSIIVALGVSGWLKLKFTPDGVAAFAMIIPIAVADCVHVINRYLANFNNGLSKTEALSKSIKSNLKPILLTSVTTMFGFLSLNFSDSPPIRMIGNTVALEVLVAGILSLTFLPAFLQLMPAPKRTRPSFSKIISHWIDWILNCNPRYVLLAFCVVTVSLTYLSFSRNQIDQTMINYFSEDLQFRRDAEWIGQNLTGNTNLEIIVDSGAPGGVQSSEYLQYLDDLSNWLRKDPYVVSVRSFSDLVKQIGQTMNEGDAAYYVVPEKSDLIAQYTLLYELSLPEGLGLTHQVNFDKSLSRLFVSLVKMSDREVLEFNRRVHTWLSENIDNQAYHESILGLNMMSAHQLDTNVKGVISGLIFSLILISLSLAFALKSTRLGLISLIPNLVPIGLAFGVWSIFVGEVGLVISVVMGMTLGIVVDDTIHVLNKYRRSREVDKLGPEDSLRAVFNDIGPALFTTTIALCLGFLVLAISVFQPNQHLGIMTSLIIGFAFLVDMIALPCALLIWDKDKIQ